MLLNVYEKTHIQEYHLYLCVREYSHFVYAAFLFSGNTHNFFFKLGIFSSRVKSVLESTNQNPLMIPIFLFVPIKNYVGRRKRLLNSISPWKFFSPVSGSKSYNSPAVSHYRSSRTNPDPMTIAISVARRNNIFQLFLTHVVI